MDESLMSEVRGTVVVEQALLGPWSAEPRVVRQSDGVTLSYRTIGTGPAVMCIQGVGVPGVGWDPQVASLAHRFHVITFDNRGIGRSGRGQAPLSVTLMAKDVWSILDAERVDRCHLVGHSMGGLIALDASLMARPRVKSLSLLCTFADGAAPTRFSVRMARLGLQSRVGTRVMRRQGMLRMLFPDRWLRNVDRRELGDRLERLFGRDLADSPPIIKEQLRAMKPYDASARLKELAGIPTLVVSGRHDPIAPAMGGKTLAHKIPGAQYVEFEDASHALPIQSADRLNALLLDHLAASEFLVETRARD